MPVLPSSFVRRTPQSKPNAPMTPAVRGFLIGLMAVVIMAILLCSLIFAMRRRRQSRETLDSKLVHTILSSRPYQRRNETKKTGHSHRNNKSSSSSSSSRRISTILTSPLNQQPQLRLDTTTVREKEIFELPNNSEGRSRSSSCSSSTTTTSPDSLISTTSTSTSSSLSTIPEIRITFPDIELEAGKRTSGGVVIVRMGENGCVGLEPYYDNHLPQYQQDNAEQFESLDLERGILDAYVGGPWVTAEEVLKVAMA